MGLKDPGVVALDILEEMMLLSQKYEEINRHHADQIPHMARATKMCTIELCNKIQAKRISSQVT